MAFSLEKIFKILLGAVVLVAACYIAYSLVDSGPNDDKLHTTCPDCGHEYPASAMATQDCPYCKLLESQNQGPQVRTLKGAGSSPFELDRLRRNKGLMAAICVICLCILMAVTHYVIKNYRIKRPEPDFSFKCFYCRRKLRYKLRQVGRTGLCPGCQMRFKFPHPSEVAKMQQSST